MSAFWLSRLLRHVRRRCTNSWSVPCDAIVRKVPPIKPAQKVKGTLILSGFVVFFQFALFLLIGVMLYAYYKANPLTTPLESNDQVFPFFIVHQLPHGIAGLVIAAIFAAAMSNLSGSLNSLSSSTVIDFYKPLVNPKADDDSLLKLSK